jgi:hypothetical protein
MVKVHAVRQVRSWRMRNCGLLPVVASASCPMHHGRLYKDTHVRPLGNTKRVPQAASSHSIQVSNNTFYYFSLATIFGMSSDGSAVMPIDTCLTVSVKDRYQITVRALGIDIEPVVALEEGTYSIPLRSSSPCGDRRKVLTHPGPEHPKISGTLPSDHRTKTLGEIKLKITTNVASIIAFAAIPALCLDLKPVSCEYSSMVPGTIEVYLKPIRRNDYLCGRDLIPSPHHRFPHHFDTVKDRVHWTFTAEEPERKEWGASKSQCPNVSLPDIEVVVPGAGTYDFDVGNMPSHMSATEGSMPYNIPDSSFDRLDSTVCNSFAGSRESSCGEFDSSSDGSNTAGGGIVLAKTPVLVPEGLTSDLSQSKVETSRPRKRSCGEFVAGARIVANKRTRE